MAVVSCPPMSSVQPSRAYFEKKLAEGKTRKEALRALKRRISDAIYARLQADARRARAKGPAGQQGNDSVASAAGYTPRHRLFGQATPGPAPTLRPRPAPRRAKTCPFPRGCRSRQATSRRSRWSARSEARTYDLDGWRATATIRLRRKGETSADGTGHNNPRKTP